MPFVQRGNGIYRLLYVYDSPEAIGIQGKHDRSWTARLAPVLYLCAPNTVRRLSMLGHYLLKVNQNVRGITSVSRF